MYGNFKFEDEIKLNGSLYFVEVEGTAYGKHFVDYDFGFESCNEIEIEKVDVEEMKVTSNDEETYEEEITEEKVLKDIEEIIQDWVKDGSIELYNIEKY